jgi:hypothetical protein
LAAASAAAVVRAIVGQTTQGGSTDSSQTTMSNFLSTLASDMQGASPIGNLLSTQA